MEENNIIDKIKKLIALSECQSATVSERELALKRAQSLMLKYSIGAIKLEEAEQAIINLEFTLSKPIFSLDTVALCRILGAIGPYFGCYSFFSKLENKVFLMGFKVNCEIVSYTAQVLINQGVRDCSRLWAESPSANTKLAFWKGFTEGLRARFQNNSEHSESLILYDKVRDKFLASTNTIQSFSGGSSLSAQQAGTQSALEAKVNQGLSSQSSSETRRIG